MKKISIYLGCILFSCSVLASVFDGSSLQHNAYYSTFNQQSNFCYACMYGSSLGVTPFYNSTFSGPWLGTYGRYRFQNWNYPGMWNPTYNSLNSFYYPNTGMYMQGGGHHAGGGLGKPYIYLSGPVGTQLQLTLDFIGGKHWVSSPPLEGGWKVKLLKDHKLLVDNAVYDHLFYDYQIDEPLLQFSTGFCGERDFILKEMVYILRFLKFQQNEIEDFISYWSQKIPVAKNYCVYPQDDNQLAKGARITFDSKDVQFIRINFLIVLNPDNKDYPSKIWKSPYKSSNAKIIAREWGVGFLLR